MKVCSGCKKNLPKSAFYGNSRRKDGLQTYCKSCSSARSRVRYENPTYKKAVRKRAEDRKAEIRKIVDEIKANPCMDCGESFPPICMDFDHLDDKVENVTNLVGSGRSIKVILDEIAKCELVCSNCHRIRTKRRYPRG